MVICKCSFIFDTVGFQTYRQNKLQISGRSLSNGRMMGSLQHGTEYSHAMKVGGQLYSVTLPRS
jgi:hypothetical protein